MDLGLAGKVALVVASSTGLGKAVAEELAREGASLILCARTEKTLKDTCQQISTSAGVPVIGVAADLTVQGAAGRVVQSGFEKYGRIDILVTNAGGPKPGTFESLSLTDWDATYQLILKSVVELCALVLPGMRERRWGRILNITSISVKQPVNELLLSNSFRAGLTGFAKTLANEVAEHGVTVNNILPGYTRTERLEELAASMSASQGTTRDQIFERWAGEIPMKRVGEPSEFAALAAFLVSERASYITGTSIQVDGGWIRGLF
jgi:3-oxoacyl-[acyl-carrier protein] reductase